MKESKQEKLERIVVEAIERAEFDKKIYEGGLYKEGYEADKRFNVQHTVSQIEKLFDRGF